MIQSSGDDIANLFRVYIHIHRPMQLRFFSELLFSAVLYRL